MRSGGAGAIDAQARAEEARGLALAIGLVVTEILTIPIREARAATLLGEGQIAYKRIRIDDQLVLLAGDSHLLAQLAQVLRYLRIAPTVNPAPPVLVADTPLAPLAGNVTAVISDAKMNGDQIAFTAAGTQYVGRVSGNAISGSYKGSAGTGSWTATK